MHDKYNTMSIDDLRAWAENELTIHGDDPTVGGEVEVAHGTLWLVRRYEYLLSTMSPL